jgi:P4 family phage/plasmid primase-like protien
MVNTGRDLMANILSKFTGIYKFATPDDVEVLYLYKDGVYVLADTIIKEEVESMVGDKTNTGLCSEVIAHFKRRSYVKRGDFNKFEGEIPVLNGLLNLNTMQLRDFDPEKIFTFKVNTKFDSSKDCPKFKAALQQILPNEEDRILLQEYAGYTLYPAFPHHKFMIFIGIGRNGKGVFIRTMEGIIGKDKISNIRLEYLDGSHRFMVANLFGVLMNVCSEPSTRKPFRTELMKQICGQDTLDGEIKNKQRLLKFVSFAKHYIQANKLPMVDDKTLSFWDRVLIIEFTMTFTDEKGNKVADIEKTWLDDEGERSGILNWMIEGLLRLKQNGKFTTTKTMDRKIIEFKQVSDPIGAFLATPEECVYGPALWVTREALYNRFKNYAEGIGAPIDTIQLFTERIKKMPGIVGRTKKISNKSVRIWVGINLADKGVSLDNFDADDADDAPSTHRNNELTNYKEGVEGASSASSASVQLCVDCKKPILDGSIILWKGVDRVCLDCARTRKFNEKTGVPGPEPAGEDEETAAHFGVSQKTISNWEDKNTTNSNATISCKPDEDEEASP